MSTEPSTLDAGLAAFPPVDEPLEISAPLAQAQADRLCPDDAGEGGCKAYHGLWQWLRLLEVFRTVRSDRDFLVGATARFARGMARLRVLVVGAADYGVLAHVNAGLRLAGGRPQITVMDRCATPLWLNRWYADREGLELVCVQHDALTFDAPGAFDLVVAHSFLSFVPESARPTLLARWAGMLSAGGVLLLSQVVRPDHPPGEVAFAPAEVGAFRERVEAAAARYGSPERLPPDLGERAACFARGKRTFNVGDPDAVVRYLRDAGLEPEAWPEFSAGADLPLSPTKGRVQRLRLVARSY